MRPPKKFRLLSLTTKGAHTVCLLFLSFVIPCAISDASTKPPVVVVVDKKTQTLQLLEFKDQIYTPIKKYHTTMGKVVGDKEEEGDLKTPEGIYQFTQKLTPPSIKPKFGDIAFYINYPNTFDQVAGRTGFDIMLHATDAPDRLKKNYDSEGCVVVNNQEVREIGEHLKLGLTPILIYSEWKPEYLEAGQTQDLEKFFTHWVTSWESKDIGLYMDGYHSHFIGDSRDKEEWRVYKTGLNKKYGKITVTIENPMYFKHPKYSVVLFSQNYVSYWPSKKTDPKDLRVAFRSKGTKMLYIAEEKGFPKIIAESFTNQVW